jgi:WD40 repeat protein
MGAWLRKLSGPTEPRVAFWRHPASIRAMVPAPTGDCDSIYLGDEDGGVCVWQPEGTMEARPLLEPIEAPVLGLAAAGDHLAVLFDNNTLRFAELSAQGRNWGNPISLPGSPVACWFAPSDRDRLVVVTRTGRVICWDLAVSGMEPRAVETFDHDDAVCCAVPGLDSTICLGYADGSICQWDPQAGRVLARREVRSPVLALVQLPQGDWVSGHENGQLCVWAPDGRLRQTAGADGDPAVLALAYLDGLLAVASGRRAAGGGGGGGGPDGTETGFGGQVQVLSLGGNTSPREPVLLHSDSVLLLRPVPGGRLVSAGADGCVKLWDATRDPQARWPRNLARHDQPVRDLIRLASGRVFSIAGRTVSCWIPPDGEEVAPELWCQGPCQVTPSGDLREAGDLESVTAQATRSRSRAVGRSDGLVQLWKASSPAPVDLARLRGPVHALAFLSDGLLVAAGEDGSIKVLTEAGNEVASWTATEPVVALTIDRDRDRDREDIVAYLRSRRRLRFRLESFRPETAAAAVVPVAPSATPTFILIVPLIRRTGFHGQGTSGPVSGLPTTQQKELSDGLVMASAYLDEDRGVVVRVATNAPTLFGTVVQVTAVAAHDPGLAEEGTILLKPDPNNTKAAGEWVVPDSPLYASPFQVDFTILEAEGDPA